MVKNKEASSRLLSLNPMITVMIETKVKKDKATKIRDKLNLKGVFMDNYQNRDN